MTHRIVLDTDMGSDVDDALCLALAVGSPEIELVAVTHVSGDTRLRARISKCLLELAGQPDIPVYAGRERPLAGTGQFVWFGHEGAGILEPGVLAEIEPEDGVAALVRLFREHDGLELVAVGPLTNVAAALEKDPELALRIAQLTVMGGHLRRVVYGGQVFPWGVDYNLCSDPVASLRVLRAGIPTRLVTADVTLQVWLREQDLRQIEAAHSSLHQALARAVRIWTPTMNQVFGGMGASVKTDNVCFLHDPLALACTYDESFCTFENLAIEPAVPEGIFRTFERSGVGDGIFRMRCAVAVDARRFRSHFVERIKRLAH
ncbi:MAG: nucleoside hydrolase [Candidatus Binatia bacterium]